jgi:hypothetical protein
MSIALKRAPRLLPLAASLSLAFGLTTHTHTASAVTLLVTDCTDGSGTGTLRHTIAAAASGDTVLIQSGTCSKITVQTSQISTSVASLTIQGPGADQLTIDGAYDLSPHQYHRIFYHSGTGTLTIQGMTLTESKYRGAAFPMGGCVLSTGSVYLKNAVVTDCFLTPPNTATKYSRGAGVYATSKVTVKYSTVSNNTIWAVGTGQKAAGVGVYAGNNLTVKYSTITSNTSLATPSAGGGAFVKAGALLVHKSTISNNYAYRGGGLFQAKPGGTGATIDYSTISGNTAHSNAGLELRAVDYTKTAKIANSTISGNVASDYQGGGGTYLPTQVYNSTIAFNRAKNQNFAVGLYSKQPITMQSSIFANNIGNGVVYDVGSKVSVLSGSGNLITATPNAVPLGTLSACPKLGPLANNGGTTLTHQLLFGSPAIDQGNLTGGSLTDDQRLAARSVGAKVDMGAYERQASETQQTDDRMFLSQFESACD